MPMGRVLFPAFVRVADKPKELHRAFCLALGVQALVVLPAGIGLALVAHTAVPLLLGPQWVAAIPLLQWLALMNIALALTHSSGYLLLALGKIRLQAILAWIQFALLLAFSLLIFSDCGAKTIAAIRLAVSIIAMALLLVLVLRAIPTLRYHDLLVYTWRPIVGSCAMAGILLILTIPADWPLAWQLTVEISTGVATYVMSLLLLWRMVGWQTGAESYLLDILRIRQHLKKLFNLR